MQDIPQQREKNNGITRVHESRRRVGEVPKR
jgi:hypothetical protein